MGLTIVHKIYPDISHIKLECEKYSRIFCGILSMRQNIVLNVKNVMMLWAFPTPQIFLTMGSDQELSHLLNNCNYKNRRSKFQDRHSHV